MKLAIAAVFGMVLGAWLALAFGGGLAPARAQAMPQTEEVANNLGRIADILERIENKCCKD